MKIILRNGLKNYNKRQLHFAMLLNLAAVMFYITVKIVCIDKINFAKLPFEVNAKSSLQFSYSIKIFLLILILLKFKIMSIA